MGYNLITRDEQSPDSQRGRDFPRFDYLIDAIEREAIPAEALEAFIGTGHPEELKDIGQVAWAWGRLDQADLAFERASASYVESRTYRGLVIAERDGRTAQDQFFQQSMEELATELGWDHEDTIDMRTTIAWGDYAHIRKSLRLLLDLRRDAECAIDPFHRTTLNIRRGIANRMGAVGETREAARMYLRLFQDCIAHLDEGEWITYASMFGYARNVGLSSTPERALELFDEFEVWMRTRRAPADTFMTLRYDRVCELRNAGRFDQALDELETIAADEERMNGRLNVRALHARCDWLKYMAGSGDCTRALRIAQDLLNEYRKSADPQQVTVHLLRATLSVLIGESGDVPEAVRILSELRDEKIQWYGEGDPHVGGIDYRLRYWAATEQARAGHFSDAVDELRRLSEDLTIEYGMTVELRRTVLHKLSELTSRPAGFGEQDAGDHDRWIAARRLDR